MSVAIETKVEPVYAVEKQKVIQVYPILGGESASEIVAYKVNGVMIPVDEFLAKYDLEFDKK